MPEEFRAAAGQPHLRLRRLPGGLPLEQVRPGRPRDRLHARDALARRRWPSWRRSTTRPSATLFAKRPVKRIGRDRFVRNVLYAIGNSGEPRCWRRGAAAGRSLAPGARRGGLGLSRLMDPEAFAQLGAERRETDPQVLEEWSPFRALSGRARRGLRPAGHEGRAALHLADLDVFVRLVGLVDGAGAADHGGEARLLELAGLGGVGAPPAAGRCRRPGAGRGPRPRRPASGAKAGRAGAAARPARRPPGTRAFSSASIAAALGEEGRQDGVGVHARRASAGRRRRRIRGPGC